MAHPHQGDLYYIIVDNENKQALYDSWANLMTWETEYDAQIYLEDHDLEDTHHVETWLDY